MCTVCEQNEPHAQSHWGYCPRSGSELIESDDGETMMMDVRDQ